MAAGSGGARETGFGTIAVHAAAESDAGTGALTVPVSLATTYKQPSPGMPPGKEHYGSYGRGYEYSRTNNPSRAAFERAVAELEDAKHCLAFASGMATTVSIINTLKTGDHVVSIDDVYGGTQRFFRTIMEPTYGITYKFVDMNKLDEVKAALEEKKTALVWLESPTNPLLKVADIAAVCEMAHAAGAKVVVDNTFATPYNQSPLTLGADIVLHSVTKYINGHSDVLMGCLCTNDEEWTTRLRFVQNTIGAVPGPHSCYLAHRGLKTLEVRMQRHNENAMEVAKFLEGHDMVTKVYYPGLPSHPSHEIAKKQMTNGFGGMVSLFVKGGIAGARAFLENLNVFVCAESLGAVESLAESPAIMTHASVPKEVREKVGIADDLVRLSVGIESIQDLKKDLANALDAVSKVVA